MLEVLSPGCWDYRPPPPPRSGCRPSPRSREEQAERRRCSIVYEGEELLESWWRQTARGRGEGRGGGEGPVGGTRQCKPPCRVHLAHPYIRLSGDGFPCVQVDHLWRPIWKSRVPETQKQEVGQRKVKVQMTTQQSGTFIQDIQVLNAFQNKSINAPDVVSCLRGRRGLCQIILWTKHLTNSK